MDNTMDLLNKQIVATMRLVLNGTITPEQAIKHIREMQIVGDRRLQVVALSAADVFAASGL